MVDGIIGCMIRLIMICFLCYFMLSEYRIFFFFVTGKETKGGRTRN